MSKASDFVISSLHEKISNSESVSLCEIGVNGGELIKKAIPILRKYDRYYYFDYSSEIDKIKNMLKGCGFVSIGMGHTRKTYDSYAWSFQKIYCDLISIGADPKIFDIVFLNGTNIFIHDMATCAIIKLMLKPNGIVVVNNTSWTFKSSKYWNPEINKKTKDMLTDEQINTSMEQILCKILFENDESYSEIGLDCRYRAFLRN